MKWKPEQAIIVKKIDDRFERLEGFDSVSKAVDQFNSTPSLCTSGACIVFSSRVNGNVLLYRSDMHYRGDDLAKIVSRLRTGSAVATSNYQFGDFAKALLNKRSTVF